MLTIDESQDGMKRGTEQFNEAQLNNLKKIINFCADVKKINQLLFVPAHKEQLKALFSFSLAVADLQEFIADNNTIATRARSSLALLTGKSIKDMLNEPASSSPNIEKIKTEIPQHMEILLILETGLQVITTTSRQMELEKLYLAQQRAILIFQSDYLNLKNAIDVLEAQVNFFDFTKEETELPDKTNPTVISRFHGMVCYVFDLLQPETLTTHQTLILQKALLYSTTHCAHYLLNIDKSQKDLLIALRDLIGVSMVLFELKEIDVELLKKQDLIYQSVINIPIMNKEAITFHLQLNQRINIHDNTSYKGPQIKIVHVRKGMDINRVIHAAIREIASTRSAKGVDTSISKAEDKKASAPVQAKEVKHIPKSKQQSGKHLKNKKKTVNKTARSRSKADKRTIMFPSIINSSPVIDVEPVLESKPITAANNLINQTALTDRAVFTETENSNQPTSSTLSTELFTEQLQEKSTEVHQAAAKLQRYMMAIRPLQELEQEMSLALTAGEGEEEEEQFYRELNTLKEKTKELLTQFNTSAVTNYETSLKNAFYTHYQTFYNWLTKLVNVPVPPADPRLAELITPSWISYYQQVHSQEQFLKTRGIKSNRQHHAITLPITLFQGWPDTKDCYLVGPTLLIMLAQQVVAPGQLVDFVQLGAEKKSTTPLFNYAIQDHPVSCHPGAKNLMEESQLMCFTINALYCNKEGVILDPTGFGLQDFKHKILRCLSDLHKDLKLYPHFFLQAIDLIFIDYTPTPKVYEALKTWRLDSKEAAIMLQEQFDMRLRQLENSNRYLAILEHYGIFQKIDRVLNEENKLQKVPSFMSSRVLFFNQDSERSDEYSQTISALDLASFH